MFALRDKRLIHAALAVGIGVAIFVLVPAGGGWHAGTWFTLLLIVAVLLAMRPGPSGDDRLRSALRDAEQQLSLQRSELAHSAAVLSAGDDAIVTLSMDGVITDWNAGARLLYGYPREEVLGRSAEMLTAADAEGLVERAADVLSGGKASFETPYLRNDGSMVQIAMTLSGILDEDGHVCGVVVVARDISEFKAREAEFHQESKLESLGRLSAGLAHEINSPIQFVGDNARFLEEAYEELIRVVEVYRGLLDTANPIGWAERQERVREAEAGIDFDYLQKEIPSAVEQTLEGIERVSTIVRAMKTFSHPGHDEQVPADLNEALEATVTVTRHQVSDIADLRLDLAELPPVLCNIADLNQVFLNLIVNAADAIEETGRRGVIGVTTALSGDDVVVQISDTGGGIPDAVRPKIFDPFFTTKDVGRGSGQGLPLARGVVHEGHGGTLTLESVPGQGTTFTVRLPIEGRPKSEPVDIGV
jgi:two-component system, NtrC family, sensor kinase